MDTKLEGQVPFNTSIYVVVFVRFDPRLLTVIVAPGEVAVNLYHTPLVVVAVAPPHAPVGAALVAPCKSPVVIVHVVDVVTVIALEQDDCEYASTLAITNANSNSIVRVVACNMVFPGFLESLSYL